MKKRYILIPVIIAIISLIGAAGFIIVKKPSLVKTVFQITSAAFIKSSSSSVSQVL
jgi:hypothetical protein